MSRESSILYAEEDGFVQAPKLTSNPPTRNKQGMFVLPFWTETPRVSVACSGANREYDTAGVLIGKLDGPFGEGWTAHGNISMAEKLSLGNKPDWLIEGSIATAANGTLVQLFRTSRNETYRSLSHDEGFSWETPHAIPLPNPNSKVAVVMLTNGWLVSYLSVSFKFIRLF